MVRYPWVWVRRQKATAGINGELKRAAAAIVPASVFDKDDPSASDPVINIATSFAAYWHLGVWLDATRKIEIPTITLAAAVIASGPLTSPGCGIMPEPRPCSTTQCRSTDVKAG